MSSSSCKRRTRLPPAQLEALKAELLALEQKEVNVKETVVVKEVVKVEKDLEMLQAAQALRLQIQEDAPS